MAHLAVDRQPRVVAALRVAGKVLGIALANAVNFVDIPVVVLGADLAVLAPHVSDAVATQLRRRVLALRWSGEPRVVRALAPPLPAMTGAALAVTDSLAADPAAYLPSGAVVN
jgi:predicted NBD/HSP70 family sugar kinase